MPRPRAPQAPGPWHPCVRPPARVATFCRLRASRGDPSWRLTRVMPPVSRPRGDRGTRRPPRRRRPGTSRGGAARTCIGARGRSATPCPTSAPRPRCRGGGSTTRRGSARHRVGGLASAEPPRVVERHAHGDREVAARGAARLGRAPVGSGGGVGVLVVLGGAVVLVERRPRRELLADDLPSTEPVTSVGGQVVVLVHARDGPVAVHAHEVQADAEVHGHQVRHAHGAASWVTPNASRKSSTARLRSFFAWVRKATALVSGMRQHAA